MIQTLDRIMNQSSLMTLVERKGYIKKKKNLLPYTSKITRKYDGA